MESRAGLTPNEQAIIDEKTGKAWTFSELNHRAAAAAGWLKSQGVKKGDRIALLSPNHICNLDLLFACGKIGAILVPLNWRLSYYELKSIIEDCNPVLMGIHQQFQHLEEELK